MGHSIWESTAFHAPPHFTVVGAGIVGLWAAIFHKRRHPQHRVLVLERGAFPSGASVRNAGFACFGSPSELLADMAKEGRDAALGRVEERWRGLLELRTELGDARIGFEPSGGHELYRAHDDLYKRVADGFDDLNLALSGIFGEAPFRMADDLLDRFGIKGFDRLTRTDHEGPVDSGMLMIALLQKAAEAGVLVRTGAAVVRHTEHGQGVNLLLSDGSAVRSEQVLFATNGFTPALLPALDVQPARGQVLLTDAIPGLALRGTFHLEEGFYYFRDYAGGILLGGGRHLDFAGEATAEEGTTPVIQEALEGLLRAHILPGRPFQVQRRWSGTMAFGSGTKEPLVQRLSERVGVAVRLSGMGVAIGIRVARRAAALMAE